MRYRRTTQCHTATSMCFWLSSIHMNSHQVQPTHRVETGLPPFTFGTNVSMGIIH